MLEFFLVIVGCILLYYWYKSGSLDEVIDGTIEDDGKDIQDVIEDTDLDEGDIDF